MARFGSRRRPRAGGAPAEGPGADRSPGQTDLQPTRPTDGPTGGPTDPDPSFGLADLTAALLVRAAHPRQALATALGMAVAAALTGRTAPDVVLVLVTVLVGQSGLGWLDDLVDRRDDERHRRAKPLVGDRLDVSTLWFSLAIAVLLVVPLAVGSGVHAGAAYLLSLAVAGTGTAWLPLRRGFFSWVPWVLSFGLLAAVVSYGARDVQPGGAAPTVVMALLAALLGLGVHVLTSLRGLLADHDDGWTYLPLRLARWLTAGRLRTIAVSYTVAVVVLMLAAGASVGVTQPPLT